MGEKSEASYHGAGLAERLAAQYAVNAELRAEVERLHLRSGESLAAKIVDAQAERDAAVREAAALRAGVEGLIHEPVITYPDGSTLAVGGDTVRVRDLRALLAEHPTPDPS